MENAVKRGCSAILLAVVFFLGPALSSGATDPLSQPPLASTFPGRQPPVAGDWLVTSPESYQGMNIQLNGNLTVESGGSLSLSNVKLSLTPGSDGEYHIEVRAGGELVITDRDQNPGSPDDATVISSSSGFPYQFWVRTGGRLTVRNSVVKDCGYSQGSRGESAGLYLQSGDCEVANATFRDSFCGIAVDGCSPAIRDCTFIDNKRYGMYAIDAGLNLTGCLFEQNALHGIWATGCTLGLSANIFRSNLKNGVSAFNSRLVLSSNIFQLNKWRAVDTDRTPVVSAGDEFQLNGLGYYISGSTIEAESVLLQDNPYSFYLQDARATLRNTTMVNSTWSDLFLTRGTDHSEATSYNCSFKRAGFGDQQSWLKVLWTLELEVRWDSSGAPVPGALVWLFEPNNAVPVVNLTTDANGTLPPLVLTQYCETKTGRNDLSYYRVGTFKGRYFNSTHITLDQDLFQTLVLDDVPPRFTLTSPRENLTVNRSWVNVTGNFSYSDHAVLTINGTVVKEVDLEGNFSQRVELAEGRNLLNITAVDDFFNVFTMFRNVTRDTLPPAVEIDIPEQGLLLNRSRYLMKGSTEPGSHVTVNGMFQQVYYDGTFETELELLEGENRIDVFAADRFQNGEWLHRTIVVDSVAPQITLSSPALSAITPPAPASPGPLAGEVWTHHPQLRIQGSVESGASAYLGDLPLELNGLDFSFSVNLTEGDNLILLRACDRAGNWNSTVMLARLDTVAPSATLSLPPEGTIINWTPVHFNGTTEPGARVSSKDGQVEQSGGDFTVSCQLYSGPNLITVELWDRAGNVRTMAVNITLDMEAMLKVLSPEGFSSTREGSVLVEGTAEPGAVVLVNGRNASIGPDSSVFRIRVGLDIGANIISINVTDMAGNTAGQSVVVFRDEPLRADYGWLLYMGAVAAAVSGAAVAWQLLRQRAAAGHSRKGEGIGGSPAGSRAAARPGPMPWEPEFERPVIKAPEAPEEGLRCAGCLRPIKDDWIMCHSCGGPTDLVSVSNQTFTRLSSSDFQPERERRLKEAFLKAHADLLSLQKAGEVLPGRLRHLTIGAQLLLAGTNSELAERTAAELSAELGPRAENLATERAKELQKAEEEARARLGPLLEEVEAALGRLRQAGADTREAERAAAMARVHLRANNMEKAYDHALEARRLADGLIGRQG